MTAIGIDLGTTNSAVAVTDANGVTTTIADRDGARVIPSVVHFATTGDVVLGARAKAMSVVEPDRIAMLFKRGMGTPTFLHGEREFEVEGKVWRPEELSSLVLKKLKQMAEEFTGESITDAVITVPAYFGEPERAATRDAAELAGLNALRILNEPTAAAISHGLDSESRQTNVLVFDLGGGTFDVTVMQVDAAGEMRVLSTGGDRRLGGADFDNHIIRLMAQHAQAEAGADIFSEGWMLQDAREKAEEIKKELSTAASSTRPLATGGRPVMFRITREQFEVALEDTLTDVRDTVETTLGESGLSESEIDTVLMVGGSSRIPAFQDVLRDLFGKEPTFSKNLDEDVARGAAVLGAKLGGQIDPRHELAKLAIPRDIASHGLGVTMYRSTGSEEMINAIVVPPGHEVPATGSEIFYTRVDGQEMVSLTINEGDEEDLSYTRVIGEGTARFGRRVPRDHPFRVDISYTADQIVRVVAYDAETGALIGEMEIDRPGGLSNDDKNQAMAAIARTGVQ